MAIDQRKVDFIQDLEAHSKTYVHAISFIIEPKINAAKDFQQIASTALTRNATANLKYDLIFNFLLIQAMPFRHSKLDSQNRKASVIRRLVGTACGSFRIKVKYRNFKLNLPNQCLSRS